MKRILSVFLCMILLVALTGCSGEDSIVGVWEQKMQISILGKDNEGTVDSLCRFTFREDGSGLREHIMPDGKYPDAVREFHYHLKDDILTLVYENEQMEEFLVNMGKDSLSLENNRGRYDLTRAES